MVGGPDLAHPPGARYENYGTFQPAFLYQSLWDVAVGLGVIWAARRFALSGERTFMLCAACYAVGSFWVESLRIGPLPQVLGRPLRRARRRARSSYWPWLVYT